MKQFITYIFIAAALLGTTTSCSDFFDVDSHHAAAEDQQWTSIQDTRAALMGIYALSRAALAENNTHWVCGELPMGDFTVIERKDLQAVKDFNLNTNIKLVKDISDYRRFYAAINAAAVFIEKAPRTVGKDQAYSEQNLEWDVAQARALRAFLYFYMARIWGSVPLITSSYDNGHFPDVAPSTHDEVLDYAKRELKSVADKLPYVYGSSSNNYYFQQADYWYGILMTKLSAYDILAHISAWQGNYADAESYCNFIIDNYEANTSGASQLITPTSSITQATGVFSSDTKTLGALRLVGFGFQYSQNEATREGHLEDLTLASPYNNEPHPDIYVTLDSLHKIYPETTDDRFGVDTSTVKYNNSYVDMTTGFPIFKKVNVVQDGSGKDNDYEVYSSALTFSRIEDIILLKAEALCVLNRPQDAITLLNQIRQARGLKTVSFNKYFDGDRMKVLDEVFNERRRELIGEGWRWYDQIRRQKLIRDNKTLLDMIETGKIYWQHP